MRYEEFGGQAWMEQLEKRIDKVERRIEKVQKGEQEVFAQERSKNLGSLAYHMPIPPWVRGIRRIRKGEEAFRIERMRKESEEAQAKATSRVNEPYEHRAWYGRPPSGTSPTWWNK